MNNTSSIVNKKNTVLFFMMFFIAEFTFGQSKNDTSIIYNSVKLGKSLNLQLSEPTLRDNNDDVIERARHLNLQYRSKKVNNNCSNSFEFPIKCKKSQITQLSSLKSSTVTEIPMSSNISSSGGLIITVPIECYQGVGEAQPQLSLVYNSQQGNGILGVGWNINGLSKITTGQSSIYYDGKVNSPNSDYYNQGNEDVYLLDGSRLILDESSKVKYRKSNSNILVKRVLASAPFEERTNGFYVYPGNGNELHYLQTGHKEYSIVSQKDKNGNEITYTYTEDQPNGIISKIAYAGQKASIEFTYSTIRPDPILFYFCGSKNYITKRLENIECKLNGKTIREYKLIYQEAKDISLLSSIECECETEKAKPLVFDYGFNQSTECTQLAIPAIECYNNMDPNSLVTLRGKFGYPANCENDAIVIYPAKEPSSMKDEKIYIYKNYNLDKSDTNNTVDKIVPYNILKAGEGFCKIIFADINKIKGEEIIKINVVTEDKHEVVYFEVYGCNSLGVYMLYKRRYALKDLTKYDGSHKEFYPIDMDGDGIWEIYMISTYKHDFLLNQKTYSTVFDLENNSLFNQETFDYSLDCHERICVTDFNCDGKTDILQLVPGGAFFYEFKEKKLCYIKSTKDITSTDLLKKGNCLLWGDYNGDGITDFIKVHDKKKQLYFGCGDFSFNESNITYFGNTFFEDWECIVQDLNGDGCSDLIYYKYQDHIDYTEAAIYLWRPNNSFEPVNTKNFKPQVLSFKGHGNLFIINTINNDDYNKIVYLYNNVMTISSLNFNKALDNTMCKAINSMGVSLDFKYGQLNKDYEFYSNTSNINTNKYPYFSYYSNAYAIKSIKKEFNKKTYNNINYVYKNGIFHNQGLGFCGFADIFINDDITDSWSINQIDPFNFGVQISSDTETTSTRFEYDIKVEDNKRNHILLKKRLEFNKLTNDSIYEFYNYNTNDKPISIKTNYGNEIVKNTEIEYKDIDNEKLYAIGFPTNTRIKIMRGKNSWEHSNRLEYDDKFNLSKNQILFGELPRSEEVYTYNNNGEMLSKSIKEYNSDNQLTETYEYDDYGRKINEKSALGFLTTYKYNETSGLLESITDSKKRTTYYNFDAWGNLTKESLPDGSEFNIERAWIASESLPEAVYKITESGNSIPTTTTYFDGLNRELIKSTVRFNDKISNICKEYDIKGNLSRISKPYYNVPTEWTYYTYDTNNRPLKIIDPAGNTTSYIYNNNSVSETKNEVTSIKTFDHTGSVIAISDPGGRIIYDLRPDGQIATITGPGGIKTFLTYDNYGRRIEINDPSAGSRKTIYDSNGNITKEIDANGNSISMHYDKFKRLISKTTSEGIITNYTYNELGDLLTETCNNGISKMIKYDALDRVSNLKEIIVDGQYLSQDYTYSNTGKINSITYTSGSGEIGKQDYIYKNGYIIQRKWNKNNIIYELKEENEQGLTSSILTGGVTRVYSNNHSGYQIERSAYIEKNKIIDLNYNYNKKNGNLISFNDIFNNKTEDYSYDYLNRLIKYGNNTVEYDNKGNIIKKSDVGEFVYTHPNKPYAITGLAPNNNTLPLREQVITYNSYMRPNTISENGYTCSYTYDTDGNKVKSYYTKNGKLLKTKYYIGDIYEKEVSVTSNTERLYIEGDYYSAPMVAINNNNNNNNWKLYNIFRDQLGSVINITDTNGVSVAEYSYDAWGRMRNPKTLIVYAIGTEPELFLGRGYIGHEHLPMFGLINMNARLYDPVLGRFLSPDPYVQAINFSQNFNRYSYCLNNPFIYVDKDGELWWLIPIGIAGVVNVIINWDSIDDAFSNNILEGIGKGIGFFAVGAGQSAATIFGGPMGAVGGAFLGDMSNSLLRDGNLKNYSVINTTTNLIFEVAFNSIGLGEAAGKAISKNIGNRIAKNITNQIISENVDGLLGAFTLNTVKTGNLKKGLDDTWETYVKKGGWAISTVKGIGNGILDSYDIRTNLRKENNESMKEYLNKNKNLEGFELPFQPNTKMEKFYNFQTNNSMQLRMNTKSTWRKYSKASRLKFGDFIF